MSAGKGDTYRPVDGDKFRENYEAIYGKREIKTWKPSAGPWVKCYHCQDVFRSESRHDFRRCKCGESFVDGGSAYTRLGGDPLPEIVESPPS